MKFLKDFKEGMLEFNLNIQDLVNSILLFFVYIIGIGFPSILAKIKKKKFLETEFSSQKSYWSDLDIKKEPKQRYYRQF